MHTNNSTPLVIKIGGSLFSDKSTCREVSALAMKNYADFLASLYREYAGHMIMITGGGSYGHAAVRDAEGKSNIEMARLTEANIQLKWLWHQLFIERGVKSFPIQMAAAASLGFNGHLVANSSVFHQFMLHRYLPVLSGDVFVNEDGKLKVVGSDYIAHVAFDIWEEPPVICFLTNVNGVLNSSKGGAPTTLARVHQNTNLASCLWRNSDADTSGGMLGKVNAMLTLAKRGARCYIVNGQSCLEDPMLIQRFISGASTETSLTEVCWENLTQLPSEFGPCL